MMEMNLQFFGGRGGSGGKSSEGKVPEATKNVTKSSADERNAQELARVQREARQSGVESVNALKRMKLMIFSGVLMRLDKEPILVEN